MGANETHSEAILPPYEGLLVSAAERLRAPRRPTLRPHFGVSPGARRWLTPKQSLTGPCRASGLTDLVQLRHVANLIFTPQ